MARGVLRPTAAAEPAAQPSAADASSKPAATRAAAEPTAAVASAKPSATAASAQPSTTVAIAASIRTGQLLEHATAAAMLLASSQPAASGPAAEPTAVTATLPAAATVPTVLLERALLVARADFQQLHRVQHHKRPVVSVYHLQPVESDGNLGVVLDIETAAVFDQHVCRSQHIDYRFDLDTPNVQFFIQ